MDGTTDITATPGWKSGIGAAPGASVGNGGVPGAASGGGMSGVGGAMSVFRRYQLPCDPGVAPPLNRKYPNAPAVIEPPWSENAPDAERAGTSACTTRMPSPTVSAPPPPALRIAMLVGPPGPTDVPSTTKVSERVAAPPSLRTVSSLSTPPLEMKVPGPGRPAMGVGTRPAWRAPVITSTSPATGL